MMCKSSLRTSEHVLTSLRFYSFISDAMGHVPLIADNSHTTRTPMALEDDRFAPTSTTMPYADEAATTVSAYLVQKLR
jgi:hypothetical protein